MGENNAMKKFHIKLTRLQAHLMIEPATAVCWVLGLQHKVAEL
jgi:hypothetical protein